MEAWDPIWYEDQIRARRPPVKWVWHVLGNDEIIVEYRKEIPWIFRIKTKLFLGSRWKKIKTPPLKSKKKP
jgi:hypothetical protein